MQLPVWTGDDRMSILLPSRGRSLDKNKISQAKIKPGYSRSVKVSMTQEDFFFCHGILSAVISGCIKDFL